MPADDWMLAQGTVDFREEERRHRNRGDVPEPRTRQAGELEEPPASGRPADDDMAGGRNTITRFADGDLCTPSSGASDTSSGALVDVKIENDYSDEHHSERVVQIPGPSTVEWTEADVEYFEDVVDKWFNEVVWDYTGDGHGEDSSLGSCYTATVVAAADEQLVGREYEWC